MTRFRIRQARPGDLPALRRLAGHLDSYNLPADRRALARLLVTSCASFRGRLPRSRARYLFVLERCAPPVSYLVKRIAPGASRITHHASRIIGCSLIIAKQGTPGDPLLWMAVDRARRTLRFRTSEDGPTELGGLVVLPAYRRHPERLGRQLSYVRFLYMAMHPSRFESRLLVELLPPLTRRGDSLFWRALGQRLTGLTYRQADRLSVTTKGFVLRAFPRAPVSLAAFPAAVRRQIGVVHPAAAGAAALLRRIGFHPLPQVEPFDGGPYYGAARRAVRLLRQARGGLLARRTAAGDSIPCLLGTEPARGEFRAVRTPARLVRARAWRVEVMEHTVALLERRVGDPVYAMAG